MESVIWVPPAVSTTLAHSDGPGLSSPQASINNRGSDPHIRPFYQEHNESGTGVRDRTIAPPLGVEVVAGNSGGETDEFSDLFWSIMTRWNQNP